MDIFNEQAQRISFQNGNVKEFLKTIEHYDNSISDELLAKGYIKKNSAERTVLFSFGEVTFSRNRWYKDGVCYTPVDDYLGLDKNSRYSKELMYQVAEVATYLPYRKVVEVFKLLCGVYITKDVVLKAVKLASVILSEQEDYRFYEEEKEDKREVDTLYIEGDGLLVKSSEEDSEHRNVEIAHFIVHEGSHKIGNNRWELLNKKEFVSLAYSTAKEALIDYIYNNYNTTNTVLITNADGGKGYSENIFKEIAKNLRFKHHEHFWDAYHVYQQINTVYKEHPLELREKVYDAIFTGNKKLLEAILTTTEGNIEDEEKTIAFQRFSQKLLNRFRFIIPAFLRGLANAGIGIMESNHRKFSYRMKRRGMYWSKSGCDTMVKLINHVHEKSLRELFFGDWRKEYAYYQELESQGTGWVLPNQEHDSHLHESVINLKKLLKKRAETQFLV